MEEDARICRLCLKIIEKSVPSSPLTNNNVVLHNLNLISFVTIKNLQLTEDPVICDLCDNMLKQLAGFKENVITNEFQIQCNQKKNSNPFLENLSKDFDKICRLCLKTSEDPTELQKQWKDNKNMFIKCNIHLNLNIPLPSKICNICASTLQTMWDFVFDCSENEKHIVDQVSKKGNLSIKNLLEISSNKVKVSKKKGIEIDNNNVSQKEGTSSSENDEGESKASSEIAKNADKIINEVVECSKTSPEEEKESKKNGDNIKEVSPEKVEDKLNKLKAFKTADKIIDDVVECIETSPEEGSKENEDNIIKEISHEKGEDELNKSKASKHADKIIDECSNTSPEEEKKSEKNDNNIIKQISPGKVEDESNKSKASFKKSKEADKIIDEVVEFSNTSPEEEKESQKNENNIIKQISPGKVEDKSNKSKASFKKAKKADKIIDEVVECSKTTTEEEKKSEKNENNVIKKNLPEKIEDELNNLHESMLDHDKNCVNTNFSEEETLLFNKTPKTYARTKPRVPRNTLAVASTSKLNILSDICLKKSEPSTSKVRDNENIIDQIQNELSGDTSIDATPVRNIADITLEMTLGLSSRSVIEAEVDNDNVTQELIDLLEGTEEVMIQNGGENGSGSNKQYKNTEELLRVLEDDADDNEPRVDEALKQKLKKDVQTPEKVKSVHLEKKENNVKNETVFKKKSPDVQKSSEFPKVKKVQNVKNLKSTKINVITKNSPLKKKKTSSIKNTSKMNVKINKDSGVQTGLKKHNLRQKTIVTSFREMLNMKPLKKKGAESAENPTDGLEKNNEIEKVQIGETSPENKKCKEEPQKPMKGLAKKRPVKIYHKPPKKTSKTNKDTTDNLQEVKETPVNASKESHNAGTVSQIEEVIFEKIQIQEISLIDEKTSESPQTQAKSLERKGPVKRARRNKMKCKANKIKKISDFYGKKAVTNTLQGDDKAAGSKRPETVSETQEVGDVVDKKRGKRKTTLETQMEVVPKKRAKKPPQKKSVKSNGEEANKNDAVSPSATKEHSRESKRGAERPDDTGTNGDVSQTDPETNDSDDSEAAVQSSDKPVVVTIIRRNKTKNRAQRDKTWQELTGKPAEKQEILEVVPKKKRGRPPLPETKRKPKKPKPTYFMCSSCPFKTISQNIILQHQYIHNVVDDVVQFKCTQCGFRATSEESLEQHKATHLTLDLIYKCMFCEFGHKKKNSTMYHTLRHEDKDIANMFYCLVLNQITDEEQYECFQCEYQNVEEAVMPDHVMDHQVEKIKNPVLTKFSCKECLYKTKFEDLLKRHQDKHEEEKKCVKVKKEVKKEPEEVPAQTEDDQTRDKGEEDAVTVYSCDMCHYLTYNKRSLVNHKGLKHTRHAPSTPDTEARRKKREPQPDEIYRCNECIYTTQKKPHLTRHMIIHRSKENMEFYECTHCIFETKHRRSYKRHMEVKHKVIV